MSTASVDELRPQPLVGPAPSDPAPAEAIPGSAPAGPKVQRWAAAFQTIAVSGIPTQTVLTVLLWAGFGLNPFDGTKLSLQFFAVMSLLDTAAIALLIRLFLNSSGEHSAAVFVGRRPVGGEVFRGLLFVPVVFVGVTAVVLGLRWLAPWTQTVSESPIEHFLRTPLEGGIFLVVVVLAGGVREELQRAFILHRFDQALGGIKVGLIVFSLLFGVLHLDQGLDVAVAIGLIGLFWGVLYIRRRSAIMAMTNHAGFNAAQVIQAMIARSLGAI